MSLTADDWPITAALLQSSPSLPDGSLVQDADGEVWKDVFDEVADAGFVNVDLTDVWVRPGDLSTSRLDELKQATDAAGIGAPAISVVRRSVIDAAHGVDNLAYSHRTLDAAAHLGVEVVSFGLHQQLTPVQQAQLWFWTVDGHQDPENNREVWLLAVNRIRELGEHAAELGILVSLEMYEDTYLGSADSSVRLVEEVGMPNVGLNPDIGNLIRLHRPIENWQDAMRKTLPYANYWHVKNYLRDEDTAKGIYIAMPAPMVSGLINYRWAVREAIAAGFQGMLCAEHYGGDGLSVSAENEEYLRKHVLPKRDGYTLGCSRVKQLGRGEH